MPNASQPFDMSKLDYEAIRRYKRRKLLVRSLAPVLTVLLIALWFVLPTTLTHQAIIAYKGQGYSAARRWVIPLTWTSPEPFVIAYNSGTFDARIGNHERAEDELTRAVAAAPNQTKRCMAAQNLAASLQAHAESLRDTPKEADAYATKAATVKKENPTCFKGGGGGGGGGGSSSQSDTSSQSQAPTKSQQQQLQQKEQEGRDRKAKFARDEEYNPNDPSIKPW